MTFRTFTSLTCGLLVMSSAGAPVFAAPASTYHVIKTFSLPGDDRWDYLNVDPNTNHLFLSRSKHVQVVDGDTGAVIGDIPNTMGVHGIALDLADGHGFTSNGGDNSVTEFDLSTFETIRTITVGNGPDCIIFDPGSKRVFTFNGRGDDSTAIDAATGAVVGTVRLDGRPEYGAADGRGRVYVNIADKSEIQAIDSKSLKVLATWPLAPGEDPSGLSIDARHHRLFSTCHNNHLVIMDTDTGMVVDTPAIGSGPDAAGFDPGPQYAFSSNGQDATLTIVHEQDPNTFDVVANVPTQSGARTMAVDTKTHRVYLVTAKFSPPPPGATGWARRGTMIPGTFTLLVVGP